jgi:hypothetical protein
MEVNETCLCAPRHYHWRNSVDMPSPLSYLPLHLHLHLHFLPLNPTPVYMKQVKYPIQNDQTTSVDQKRHICIWWQFASEEAIYLFKIAISLCVGFRWSHDGSARYDDHARYQRTLEEVVAGVH